MPVVALSTGAAVRSPVTARVALVGALALVGACAPRYPPGLSLPDPVQEPVPSTAPSSFVHHGAVVQPRALYAVEALVLGSERYRFDANASVSPLDVALGWGPMSDASVLRQLRIRQHDRYFFWSTSEFPLAREDIEQHAANTHLLWGKKDVGDVLDDVDVGDVVSLRGALVNVTFKDGHEMISSLSRNDVGGGSCEVMWVDEAKIVRR